LLAVAAVGGATMAWFTDQSDPLENVFTAGTVIISAGEQIISGEDKMDNWNPGDCAEKEFTITNSGTKAIALRGIVTQKWYELVGTEWVEWTPDPAGSNAAKVTLVGTGWTEDPDEPGTWYYDGPIAGTFTEDNPVEVKLNFKVCLDGPEAGNQYQGKRYIMSVTFQAIQASHEGGPDGWEWDDNINFETGLVEED
jgi:predicted ribosomally synthesized peptide with SipW-like signal peptide